MMGIFYWRWRITEFENSGLFTRQRTDRHLLLRLLLRLFLFCSTSSLNFHCTFTGENTEKALLRLLRVTRSSSSSLGWICLGGERTWFPRGCTHARRLGRRGDSKVGWYTAGGFKRFRSEAPSCSTCRLANEKSPTFPTISAVR